MEFHEKNIAQLIKNQFPSFYNEEGPVFIEFVKKYYEWMETSNNTLYHSRRLMEYGDIDSTIDDFLLYFKSKYLNSMQFTTATDTRQLVKHSLDLYRSKGSERSIDLFFKTIFNVPATIYYPGDDMFRLSNGEWVEPKYLEMSFSDNLNDFIGLQIEGINSGATAFVEKYIRKKVGSKYIELYYISDMRGIFQTGERIKSSISNTLGPTIIGSLTNLTVVNGVYGYSIGDIVNISSDYGIRAKARVSNTADVSGAITFTLEDGGWGYTSNSEVIIANAAFRISDVKIGSNNYANLAYNQFETIIQPKANVIYTNLSGNNFTDGDLLYRYDPITNSYAAEAQIISSTNTSSTNGELYISLITGTFACEYGFSIEDGNNAITENSLEIGMNNERWPDAFLYHDEANNSVDFSVESENGNNIVIASNTFFKIQSVAAENDIELLTEASVNILSETDDTIATIVSYEEKSATANVMSATTNTTLNIINSSTPFSPGEIIYQTNGGIHTANGYIQAVSYTGYDTATLAITNTYGTWTNGNIVQSINTSANGYISNVIIDLQVHSVNGTFISTNNNIIDGFYSNTTGTVILVSTGNGASITLNNTFTYTEQTNINSDSIYSFVNIALAANDYGFDVDANTDINTVIADALNYNNYNYGTISSITVTGAGNNYSFIPYVYIYEPSIVNFEKSDFIINLDNTSKTFLTGEVVLQSGQNKGIVKPGSNSSYMKLKRLTFDNTLDENDNLVFEDSNNIISEANTQLGTDNAAQLIGLTSGATATISSYSYDILAPLAGFNAIINSNTTTSNGTVLSLEVIDSGYGFYNNEVVNFSSNNGETGTAIASLETHGTSEGFYRRNDSLLSDNKYLQDSYYYQEFSYEIRTSITLNKYKDMLKNILHIAGTKQFNRFYLESEINDSISAVNTNITVV